MSLCGRPLQLLLCFHLLGLRLASKDTTATSSLSQESIWHWSIVINQEGKNQERCHLQCLNYYPPTKEIKNDHSLSHMYNHLRFQISQNPDFKYAAPSFWFRKCELCFQGPRLSVCTLPETAMKGFVCGGAQCPVVLLSVQPPVQSRAGWHWLCARARSSWQSASWKLVALCSQGPNPTCRSKLLFQNVCYFETRKWFGKLCSIWQQTGNNFKWLH